MLQQRYRTDGPWCGGDNCGTGHLPPAAGWQVVFITLEDEFGHIPLMVFPQVYESQELKFKSPFLVVKGTLSRREGTHNVVVNQVRPFRALEKIPRQKTGDNSEYGISSNLLISTLINR